MAEIKTIKDISQSVSEVPRRITKSGTVDAELTSSGEIIKSGVPGTPAIFKTIEEPQRFLGKSGLENIDLDLQDCTGQYFEFEYISQNNLIKSAFNDNTNDTPLASFIIKSDNTETEKWINYKPYNCNTASGVASSNTITYENVYNGVDIQYENQKNDIKQYITLKDSTAQTVFDFTVTNSDDIELISEELPLLSIQYTGVSAEGTIEVTSNNHIIGRTQSTTSFDLDLTSGDYDTFQELVDYIDNLSSWSASIVTGSGTCRSKTLSVVGITDCKTSEITLNAELKSIKAVNPDMPNSRTFWQIRRPFANSNRSGSETSYGFVELIPASEHVNGTYDVIRITIDSSWVSSEFGSGATEIIIDPTTYRTIRDYGNITFCGDYASGNQHGTNGFMNGYGLINRGTEAVQTGGTRVEDTSSLITYVDPDGTEYTGGAATKGVWSYSSNANYSDSNVHYTITFGAKVKLTFTGTEVWAGVSLYASSPMIKIYIDGEFYSIIDLYTLSTTYQRKLLLATGLTNESHTVEIEVINQQNISSINMYVNFDFFEYYTSGNELASKDLITINSRETYGLDCTYAKHPKGIQYDAKGNLYITNDEDPERGSFSCWIKPNFDYDADANNHWIFGKEAGTEVSGDMRLYYNGTDDKFHLSIYNGANWTTVDAQSAAQTFSSGDVLHIAATWNETIGANLYVNNIKTSDTSTWTSVDLAGNIVIGNNPVSVSATEQANMIIAEPTLFDYVLTDEEVYDIYTSTKPIWEMDFGRRVEILNRTNKGMLFNYSGVMDPGNRIGSFAGKLYKVGAPSGTFITESEVTFVGSWTDGGNYRWSNDQKAYATTTFTGTEIWAGYYARSIGEIAEYIIDEGTSKEKHILIDQYFAGGGTDQYLLIATGLDNVLHTLKVRHSGIKNLLSTAYYIHVGLNSIANRMFLYTASGSENIASDSMTVNNRLIDNVLKCEYSTMGNAIQFPDKGNISEYDHEGTVECVVKTSWAGNDGNDHYIMDTRDSGGYNGFEFQKTAANNLAISYRGTSTSTSISVAVNDTSWAADTEHHVLIKWWRPTSSTMGLTIYLDGVKLAENKSLGQTPSSHSKICIGNNQSPNSSHDFEGQILDLSIHNHAFNDGGIPVGSYVDPTSEVGQSYRGYCKKTEEDLSDQVGDGSTTTFKLSKGLLEREYPNDSGYIWSQNKLEIDSSPVTARNIVYDTNNDIYYVIGSNVVSTAIYIWYSSSSDINTCTWTRRDIASSTVHRDIHGIIYDNINDIWYLTFNYESAGDIKLGVLYSSSNDLRTATFTNVLVQEGNKYGYDIIYDSTNLRYYICGLHHNSSSSYNGVIWYSSSNNLTTATWTLVSVESGAGHQRCVGIVYDSTNDIYYIAGSNLDTNSCIWYSSSNDLTTATWTRVNIGLGAGRGITYDSVNERYLVTGSDDSDDAVLWCSSSNDLTTATWTKVNIFVGTGTQQAWKSLYDSTNKVYYVVGYDSVAGTPLSLWKVRISNHLTSAITNNISVTDDSTSLTIFSVKLGTYCRTNGAISATDTTIVVDSFTNSESEIDTNGGYLWIGQANNLWRKKVEYSSYDSTANIFTVSDSGTVGEDFADNTIIEVCGTVTLSAAPAEGSKVECTYYYSGDSVDREYGLIPDRLDKNLWLDYTGNPSTGWDANVGVTNSHFSGDLGLNSFIRGQVQMLNCSKSSALLSYASGAARGIAQLIVNQGTINEKSILVDMYNSSTVYQITKLLFESLPNYSILRHVVGVDKNASSSNYETMMGTYMTPSQYDLTADALISNDVNCVFDYSAIRVIDGQLDYDRDKSGNLQLKEAITSTDTTIYIDTDTASDIDRLGRPHGIFKVDNEFIYYEDFADSTSSTEIILLNCKRGYMSDLTGGTADSHSGATSIQLVGAWRNNINAMNQSWYPQCGAFPYRALLIGCGTIGQVEGGLVIRDLDQDKNYKVLEANDNNAIRGAVKFVSGHTGKICASYGDLAKGFSDIDFISNEILNHGIGVGYGSAAATKGTISQVNDELGWSYTTHIGVTLNSNYVNDIIMYFDATNYNVWASIGKSGATGVSAGINRIYDGGDGLLDIKYDLDSDTSYWATKLCYDITNDDLYVSQTNGSANQDILSKISTPKITSNSTIDTADGSTRLTSQPICNDISLEGASNIWFASDSGAKSVVKSTFSSIANTLDSTSFTELDFDSCQTIDYDPCDTKLLIGFGYSSDGLLINCNTNGANPIYYDKSSETDADRNNVLTSDIIRNVCNIYQDYREIGIQYTSNSYPGWAVATDTGITIKEPEGQTYSQYSDLEVSESNGVYTISVTGTPRREITMTESNGVYTRTLDTDPNPAPMTDKIITESNGVYTSTDQS